MHKWLKKCLVFSLCAIFIFAPVWPVAAAEFSPHFLVSDEEIQNSVSMNREDIQAFLDHKGGYVAGLQASDVSNTMRFAADIIARAANDYRINPKYLLVKLQKEQSLVTDPIPTQKQIDWAAGYGVCDSCTTDDPNIQKFRGFGTQVDKAAGIIRWYYDNVDKETWIKRPNNTYLIDGTPVMPANLATAFLYTYTPHLNGNKNFWTIWQRWFEQVYPNGTLLKAMNSSTVYLLQEGKKRPITSMTALVTRFNPKLIITTPENELARYESSSPISLPNYSILRRGGDYYLLDYDTIRPFANAEVVRKLGYNPDEIIDVADSDVAGYTMGPIINAENNEPRGRLVRLQETKELYYLKDKQYHAITDPQIVAVNFSDWTIDNAPVSTLAGYERGEPVRFKDGTLLGVKGGNNIYVIEAGKKRHIATEEVFTGLGYSWNNILWTDEMTGFVHETGEPLYVRVDFKLAQASPAPENFPTPLASYLVADEKSGEILAGKDIDQEFPAASLVKAMSAYQLLLDGLSLSRGVTYAPEKHKVDTFRLAAGESVLNEHLMYAMLVSSLNTPTKMLVVQTGSEEAFVKRMNKTAIDWGLTHTVFADPYGIDPGSKTTAKEFLYIFNRITKNSDLASILRSPKYEYRELIDRDGHPLHQDKHTNELMAKKGAAYTILESKTGYLAEAGAHLAMTVERQRDRKKFIIITLGNPDSVRRFDEPQKLLAWVMKTF
ncbi:MAG: D-alanyl-D-alanine carboxypeptidase [Candidatus Magasanikbacteria bacterium]|nr:D-alanyl-D-alanine carboxypeptidase [Candidatus Magasanikbacteria bacterium]